MIYFFSLLFILLFRLFVLKKASSTAVDQWYWLKYRDAVRKQEQCPPELPEYLLEVKQWYPPFFGYFISKLPDGLFSYSLIITQLLSLFRLILIILFASLMSIDISFSLFLIVIVYLTAPILVYYDNQINSRIFGAIIVDLLVLSFYGYFELNLVYLLFPLIFLTTLLLLTHKMSHQLYLFLLFAISLFYVSVVPIVIYLLATIVAIMFFNYKNYLKHHIEIVKFWHRNRYKLGAHQFYESLIYGQDDFVYVNRLHGDGVKSIIKKLSLIVGMFPFALFIIFNFDLNYFGLVILTTLFFIFLTSFVDYFLCLGSGSLYTYNVVSFSSFYLVVTPISYTSLFNVILLGVVGILTSFSIYKFFKGLRTKGGNNDNLTLAIEYIKNSSLDRIMVIPFQLPDEVAYKTDKKVFWGGHGYGMLWLEPYFPVFNEKIETAIHEWNLGAILLKKDYFREFFDRVDMSIFNKVFENDEYIIFSVKKWKNIEKIPNWAIGKYVDDVQDFFNLSRILNIEATNFYVRENQYRLLNKVIGDYEA